jgi:hypothetical protein
MKLSLNPYSLLVAEHERGLGGRTRHSPFSIHPVGHVSAVRAGSWLLSPTDPLFPEITAVYLKVQTQLLGTDHMYNADTFNGARPYTHWGGLRVLYISCAAA